jgi:hypothetical protein
MAISLVFVGVVKTQLPTVGNGTNDQSNAELILDYIATLSGSYTAGGDPIDFTAATLATGFNLPPFAPTKVEISELAVIGTEAPGFQYDYAYGPAGATASNPYTPQGGAIQIKGAGAGSGQGGTAISGTYAGTTPALTCQLKVRAWFSKG